MMAKLGTKPGISTLAVHAGQHPDPTTGAVMTPIYQTSTYAQEALGRNKGFEYARTHNATRAALERNLAGLEGAKHGLSFASGLAATNALIQTLSAGDHVVCGQNTYGGTFRLFDKVWRRHGIEFTFVDAASTDAVASAFTPKTRFVFVETPTNPLMQLTDIAAVSERARKKGIMTVVDNTFMSPYFQRPLELGADVAFHSVTKYLNGHSDLIGGALLLNDDALHEQLRFLQNAAGAVPGPMDCFLALRGTKTLAVRMQRHDENARELAAMLASHPRVSKVFYPGLPNHPQHALAKRQASGFGGMISIIPGDGSLEAGRDVFNRFQLFTRADGLLRLSVGIEDVADLRADLERALGAA